MSKLKQQDLDFIYENINQKTTTKFVAKKLQRIWNDFKPKEEHTDLCMCTDSERVDFIKNFYVFYNKLLNDIKSIEI